MKIVSEEHFQRMQMMCRVFEANSRTREEYLPEFKASKAINELIEKVAKPSTGDFLAILNILNDLDNVQHKNGSQWFDYKIHVSATLRANGFER